MFPDTRTRPADSGDPAREAALHRLSSVTAPVGPASAPWSDADPDGRRPERVPPADPDPAAWADPPWWRRIRWAPDRVAGIALVVLVLGLGGFSVHRLLAAVPEGSPVPDLPLATPGVTVPADGSSGPGAAEVPGTPEVAAPDEPVVVSVVGLVGRSGLVTVTPGARVADALDSAGGVLDGGDRDGLNLARKVVDGEQILVGLAPGPDGPRGPRSGIVGADDAPVDGGPAPGAGVGAGEGAAPGAAAGGGLVDLNTADATTLETLPGVGPVTASSILAWRAANGAFASIDQLAEVDGIGPVTLARLRPLVTV
ncbi:ComEA family DNA-binding protein [Dietzia psychralcaliphila]|uniref:DNA-binding protein n=1 Tax=Dietzia psychralcaliphila TaxID=139021 RepID=A0AAD0JQQ9_9ACTN|nr:ComEA family DNA-binding protein [Dietzia psychralcaliphila]AWH95059.1 DNA-binding protein [Dietzia psychralcaliphila]PTM87276.1 competence protein ComEA [Dietzia psychralcaliphila]